jgi:hypothetical protein
VHATNESRYLRQASEAVQERHTARIVALLNQLFENLRTPRVTENVPEFCVRIAIGGEGGHLERLHAIGNAEAWIARLRVEGAHVEQWSREESVYDAGVEIIWLRCAVPHLRREGHSANTVDNNAADGSACEGGCNCDCVGCGGGYHVRDALEFLRVAVRDAPVQHAVERLHHGLRVCFVVVGGGGNERGEGDI